MSEAVASEGAEINEVRLVGRVSGDPQPRTMPSGDVVWVWRVVVARPDDAESARRVVDALECAAWGGRVQRSVARWNAGDVVEVSGRLRRRFYGAAGAKVSRVEVDVLRGRLIRRASP